MKNKMSYKPPSNFKLSEDKSIITNRDDVELLLIRVPKKFDINILNGVDYVPGQIHNFAVEDQFPGQLTATYQLNAANGQGFDVGPLVQKGSKEIVGPSVNSLLSVTKSYKVESKPSKYTLPNYNKLTTNTVPMPEGLQVRFTPFGAGAPVQMPRHGKAHKKKRKRDQESAEEEEEQQNKRRKKDNTNSMSSGSSNFSFAIPSMMPPPACSTPILQNGSRQLNGEDGSSSTKKHKKKHKKDKKRIKEELDDSLTNGVDSSMLDESQVSEPEPTSNKKKQRKSVSFCQNDSVFVFGNSSGEESFLSKSLKSEKPAADPILTASGDASSSSSDTKHSAQLEKAKRKLSSGYSSADSSLDTDETPTKKSKKKKHKSKDIEAV